MAFRFSLQAVLRVRAGLKRQQEIKFRLALAEVVRIKNRIETLTTAIRESENDDRLAMQVGVSATTLHCSLSARSKLTGERERFQSELKQKEEIRKQQLTLLQQRRADLEKFETLRRQQRAFYQQENQRRESQALDEMFLLRREFLKRIR